MNAPENCGRAPPQVCAGGVFGPQAKPSPAGDGLACGPPLPLRKLRLYAKYIPYNSIKFILFSTDLPPTAIRQVSIFYQKSASIGPSSCKGLAWETAARPLLHRLCARPRNRGAAPSGSAGGAGRSGRRGRPSGGPGCAPPFFGFYTARTLSSNYTDIRQNPPRFCDHKCRVSFLPHQSSAEQFSERKSKITSSAMVLRLWERKMPLSGKGSPVRLR